ncbi:platelet factor 4-like [Urocitellus parryii]|uniref:Chemokine interleukin-8-like domain-containing protein n=1 Tax=Urocitellus parryii TaxID=9999 RepID=A0A8D2KE31_UROPR
MGLRLRSCSLCPQLYPGLLLLGLLLLSAVVTVARSEDPEEDREFQCMCAKTRYKVKVKDITNLEMIKPGPHCATAQMIATLKSGNRVCLAGQVSFFKALIGKLMQR